MSAGAPANIAAALVRRAEEAPDELAIVAPRGREGAATRRRWTWQELNRASDEIARGLEVYGVGRGCRTAVMVRPGLELFALVFGLFKSGAVPVMIDPGIGIASLKTCLAEAAPEAFIGVPAAQLARIVLGWARQSVRKVVTVGPRLLWGGTTLARVRRLGAGEAPYDLAATEPDETAAILFTSGSTGVPKGAVYRHGNFLAQVEAIRSLYGIAPGEVDMPTFPLFGLFDPALGMTTVIPDMDPTRPAKADPRRLLPAMEEFAVTNLFGSPALLNTLGRYGEQHGVRVPTLTRVISAGAPVPLPVIERVVGMLGEGGRVVTPYGATESLPVASIGSEELLGEPSVVARRDTCEGVCVGRPLDNVDLRLIEVTDEPIPTWSEAREVPAGTIGELVVTSPMTTAAYFRRERATELAKIRMPDGAIAHRMGDLGFLDDEGRLWFCGRKSQRVRTERGTLYTVPGELVFDAHPAVFRSALVGVAREGRTVPVVCVELEPGARPARATLLAELRQRALSRPHTVEIETFLVHPGFPVDIRHNAKIRRSVLAEWAAGQLGWA